VLAYHLATVLTFLLGVAHVLVYALTGELYQILWFCSHQALVMGAAMYLRSSKWITAQLSLGIIPQVLWGLDFAAYAFTGTFPWGISDYMADPVYNTGPAYYLSLKHYFLAPLGLYALYKIGKPSRTDWHYAVLHLAIMVPLSVFLVSPELNVNCAYKNTCLPVGPIDIPYWPVVWLGIYIFIITIPTNYLLCWVFKKMKSRRDS